MNGNRVANTARLGARRAHGTDARPGAQVRRPGQRAETWQRARSRICAWAALAGALLVLLAAPSRAAPSRAAQALVRAAVAHAHLDEATTHKLRARAHLAPLLPSLRVSAGQGWQIGYSRGIDGLSVPSLDGDRFSYAVSAGWDLSHVLLPREELSLLRELPRRAQLRTRLELQVLGLLAERCRLQQAASARAPSSPSGQRLAEVELLLEVLSGGHPLPEPGEPCLQVGGDLSTRTTPRRAQVAAPPSSAPPPDLLDSGDPADPAEPLDPGRDAM